jgi:hypothetical protein
MIEEANKGRAHFFSFSHVLKSWLEGSSKACPSFSQIYEVICTCVTKVMFIGSEESATFLFLDPDLLLFVR